jgi:hypothetical protein
MATTVVRGGQIKDATIQRVDLDTSTAGQAVVAKIVQGTGITISSTGADSGTGDVTINGKTYASLQTTAASPSGTTSTTGVMAGLGLAEGFTPSATGKILIIISGSMYNTSASGGATCAIRYGTGTAPANGAALTGTQIGASAIRGAIAVNERMPFSVSAVITGLAVGTQIWTDLNQAALTAGTAVLVGVAKAVVELP